MSKTSDMMWKAAKKAARASFKSHGHDTSRAHRVAREAIEAMAPKNGFDVSQFAWDAVMASLS